MKKIFLLIITGFVLNGAFSQDRILHKEFLSCTLLVARSNEFPYLEEAFKKYWNICDYKFIYPEEIDKYNEKNDNYYFFVVHDVQRPGITKTPGSHYHFAITPYFSKSKFKPYSDHEYYIIKGIARSFEYLNMPAFEYAYIPLSKRRRSDTAFYKAETIRNIIHLRDYLRLVFENKVSSNPAWSGYVKNENNKYLFQEKTLLLDSNSCKFRNLTSKHYPFQYTITSENEINEAICNHTSDVIYHRVTLAGYVAYHYFINAEDGKLLYSTVKSSLYNSRLINFDLQKLTDVITRQDKKSKRK